MSEGRFLPPWRLFVFLSLPPLLICAGAIGYRLIERWSWFDSIYVAVTSLTSLGSGVRHATSQSGRVLTLGLALAGVSTLALAATELLSAIMTGELREYLRSRRMTRRIEALEQHVIVCGHGQVGQHVCAEIIAGGVPVVVVDRQDEALALAREAGAHAVLGDASDDDTLRRAGIERARALVTVAGSDPDNVLITMTARLMQPALPIVSRSDHEATVPKLLRAGATRTASPHLIAGERIADVVLHPATLAADLQMRESMVRPGDAFDGLTVGACGLRGQGGPILIAIRHRDGSVVFNPADHVRVDAGDVVITLNQGPQRDHRNGSARPA
ncbi:MAG TPA: NAD-binding protein [Polyangia bacterium]|nr:NAD-binding protein [Polyangia bacterium]